MSEASQSPSPRRPLPRWKKALLIGSALAVVVGAGLKGFAYFANDSGRSVATDPSKRSALGLDNSLVDGAGRSPAGGDRTVLAAGDEGTSSEALSPFLLQGGLSFFAGFCMGFAVRSFLKISAFFIGGALLVFFALQYFGVVPGIDWASMEGHFNNLMASLAKQMSQFHAFIAGHLPSSAAATAGVFTGWKKN